MNLIHFNILPRTDPAGKVLTFRFQVNMYKTTRSLPWVLALAYLLATVSSNHKEGSRRFSELTIDTQKTDH